MRVVHAVDEAPSAIAASRREALAAFGDSALHVERFLPTWGSASSRERWRTSDTTCGGTVR